MRGAVFGSTLAAHLSASRLVASIRPVPTVAADARAALGADAAAAVAAAAFVVDGAGIE
jgi:hypothetical protein